MFQFLSIIFFSWISSIFVGFFKSSRFFVSSCTTSIFGAPRMAGPQKQPQTALGLTRPATQQHIRDNNGNCALWSLLPAWMCGNVIPRSYLWLQNHLWNRRSGKDNDYRIGWHETGSFGLGQRAVVGLSAHCNGTSVLTQSRELLSQLKNY